MPTYGTFSEGRERNEEGWLLYPRDIELRKGLFPTEAMNHPAKQNIYIFEDLMSYLTKPGDLVLDPFGGSGTSLLATRFGRDVWMIEIEQAFHELQQKTLDKFALSTPPVEVPVGQPTLKLGNAQYSSAYPADATVDAIITSPPYASNITGSKQPLMAQHETDEDFKEGLANYVQSPQNLGRFNSYVFENGMQDCWKQWARVLKPGGVVAMTIKDQMENGQRNHLWAGMVRQASKVGLRYLAKYQWLPPSTIRREYNLSRGANVVLEEDILLIEKPE